MEDMACPSLPERRQRFEEALAGVLRGERTGSGIGVLRERTLHAVLKRYMEPYQDNHEIKIGPYVADIVGETGIVEIQTRGFSKLRAKLTAFLEATTVTVVYPIASTKWLSWIDPETGEASPRRKSPRRGRFQDVFYELVYLKPLLTHPNLRFHIILLDMEEYRRLDGWSRDRKRGATRSERIPLDVVDELTVGGPQGYGGLLPPGLPAPFTSRDFAEATGMRPDGAGTALNVLLAAGAVTRVGKRGRHYLYERTL